jgi:hypothetical protein
MVRKSGNISGKVLEAKLLTWLSDATSHAKLGAET